MKQTKVFLFLSLCLWSMVASAWDHSVQLAYGRYQDPNDTKYDNSGFFLNSNLYVLRRTPSTFWSIDGALGQWHSTAPEHQNLTTAALSLGLRYYPFNVYQKYPAYINVSEGLAYLSQRKFGTNVQGMNVSFQSLAGLGVELNHIDVGLRFVHYSNANTAYPNEGFNFFYMLSIGYLFC